MSKALVLVVDDDPVFCAVAGEALTAAGFEPEVALDGAEAVDAMARRVPALVLLDMLMPHKDGIEALKEIRKRWPAVPVAAISGGSATLGPDLLLKTADLLGAAICVQKPLSGRDIVRLTKTLIGSSPPGARSGAA